MSSCHKCNDIKQDDGLPVIVYIEGGWQVVHHLWTDVFVFCFSYCTSIKCFCSPFLPCVSNRIGYQRKCLATNGNVGMRDPPD